MSRSISRRRTCEIRIFAHGSANYERAVRLRTKILREPLGLAFDPAALARENVDVHIGAFEDSQLVGCLILTKVDDRTVKMRQVAVDSSMQGSGLGRALVEFSEAHARSLGHTEMVLSARDTAVPFYQRLGYECIGEPFTEVTLPHRKMRKTL